MNRQRGITYRLVGGIRPPGHPPDRVKSARRQLQIRMWGNSLALRIPKPFAEEVGLQKGTSVELSLQEGKLIISRSNETLPTLEDLLRNVAPANIHQEFDTGGPVQSSRVQTGFWPPL
jgi:antitoxin MazE